MNYSKPTVTELGNAALVIQGNAQKHTDSGPLDQTKDAGDCELDD